MPAPGGQRRAGVQAPVRSPRCGPQNFLQGGGGGVFRTAQMLSKVVGGLSAGRLKPGWPGRVLTKRRAETLSLAEFAASGQYVSAGSPAKEKMMSKLVRKIFCLLVIFLLAAELRWPWRKKVLSTAWTRVAAAGESKADKTKPITECRTPYSVAVLPYVDASGLEGRSRRDGQRR